MQATIVSSREDVVALVRARQNELGLACLTVDDLAGLANGHFSKLTCQAKGIGFVSLFLVLPALGLRLRIEEDPSMIARLRARWTQRNERTVRRRDRWREQRKAAHGAAA